MITTKDIQNAVAKVHHHHFAGTKTMACLLIMTNGHAVLGQAHAAMDTPFSLELGMAAARSDAERGVAQLLAFQQRPPVGVPK